MPPHSSRRLAKFYLDAKQFVIDSGYFAEIDRQEHCAIGDASERDLLRETAWVVLSSGIREQVVRRSFPGISNAFLQWVGAEQISKERDRCTAAALRVFRHRPKIEAIAHNCELVRQRGATRILQHAEHDGPETLQQFRYIGGVTCWHLAKNLGLDVVKPDRHLLRLAGAAGYESPTSLCRRIAEFTGDRLAVIDIVLWRYANLVPSCARQLA